MKSIVVLGANGRSGKTFIRYALASGYHIKAGVHSGSIEPHENLEVVKIDSTHSDDIKSLISNADAVVSLIGHGKSTPEYLLRDTMSILVNEMPKKNVSKLISLTGTGVRFKNDNISFSDHLVHVLLKVIMPKVLKDGKAHAEVLKSSDLDWTIIRALVLTNGKQTKFRLTSNGPAKFLCPRENIAVGILQILESEKWTKQAPIVSK